MSSDERGNVNSDSFREEVALPEGAPTGPAESPQHQQDDGPEVVSTEANSAADEPAEAATAVVVGGVSATETADGVEGYESAGAGAAAVDDRDDKGFAPVDDGGVSRLSPRSRSVAAWREQIGQHIGTGSAGGQGFGGLDRDEVTDDGAGGASPPQQRSYEREDEGKGAQEPDLGVMDDHAESATLVASVPSTRQTERSRSPQPSPRASAQSRQASPRAGAELETASSPQADESEAQPASPKSGAQSQQASPKAGAESQQASPEAGAQSQPASPKAAAQSQQASPKAGATSQQASPKAGAQSQQASPKAGAKSQQASPKAGAQSQQAQKAGAQSQRGSPKAGTQSQRGSPRTEAGTDSDAGTTTIADATTDHADADSNSTIDPTEGLPVRDNTRGRQLLSLREFRNSLLVTSAAPCPVYVVVGDSAAATTAHHKRLSHTMRVCVGKVARHVGAFVVDASDEPFLDGVLPGVRASTQPAGGGDSRMLKVCIRGGVGAAAPADDHNSGGFWPSVLEVVTAEDCRRALLDVVRHLTTAAASPSGALVDAPCEVVVLLYGNPLTAGRGKHWYHTCVTLAALRALGSLADPALGPGQRREIPLVDMRSTAERAGALGGGRPRVWTALCSFCKSWLSGG
jgi:hypothetical protein